MENGFSVNFSLKLWWSWHTVWVFHSAALRRISNKDLYGENAKCENNSEKMEMAEDKMETF